VVYDYYLGLGTPLMHIPDKPETALNAPIGVQLAAQTLEEEALLGMGEIVDAAVKQYLGHGK
jgi:Asp-tRNA(Asn)/Glu-tRNA(Gln) amidotransferase A subunit family amidase